MKLVIKTCCFPKRREKHLFYSIFSSVTEGDNSNTSVVLPSFNHKPLCQMMSNKIKTFSAICKCNYIKNVV